MLHILKRIIKQLNVKKNLLYILNDKKKYVVANP